MSSEKTENTEIGVAIAFMALVALGGFLEQNPVASYEWLSSACYFLAVALVLLIALTYVFRVLSSSKS